MRLVSAFAFAFVLTFALGLAVTCSESADAANKCELPFTISVSDFTGTMEVSSSSLKEPQKAKAIQLIDKSEILAKDETINVDFITRYGAAPSLIRVTCNGKRHLAAFSSLPPQYEELFAWVRKAGHKVTESKSGASAAPDDATKVAEVVKRLKKGDPPFKLTLRQTGGFAGVDRTHEVDSSTISSEAREQIARALADSGLLTAPFIKPSATFTASDAFHEAIKFEYDGSVRGVYYDDPGTSTPALKTLGALIKKYDSSRPKEASP